MQIKQIKTKPLPKTAVKKVIAKKLPTKVSKKVATKKNTAKKNDKRSLVYAPDQKSFWVKNGQILNSLIALRDALEEMESEVYFYHAGEAHNDFAKWVADVLADDACAVELGKAKNPKSAKTVIVKHLKSYSI
ncbi:hypothetical protein GW937_02010 [Candidatus Kaiserbacteria bacterium]|nr:hypothetical protein [Candidatus Kaiserbacteria bacterium]NCT02143.1 hypothetical protein [Candidatus Parcubacteria bacterium]